MVVMMEVLRGEEVGGVDIGGSAAGSNGGGGGDGGYGNEVVEVVEGPELENFSLLQEFPCGPLTRSHTIQTAGQIH